MKRSILRILLSGVLLWQAATDAVAEIGRQKDVVFVIIGSPLDFHYQEYADTRRSIEEAGLSVLVGAATTARAYPHPNSGEPAGTDGSVVPDVALADANASDYSAIVFVGGWGSSMYQYAFNDPNADGTTDNYYAHGPYNGDDNLLDGQISPTKVIVNQLINEFLAQDKPVAGICHGTTVLAWARVQGASPLKGRVVAAPFIGSPAAFYGGKWYGDFELGQREQLEVNGALPNFFTGQNGDPTTVLDDVVVDGRIITAENYESAAYFGKVVAREAVAAFYGGVFVASSDVMVEGTPGDDVIFLSTGAKASQVIATINGVSFGPYTLPSGGRAIVRGGAGNDQILATNARFPTSLFGGPGKDLLRGGKAADVLVGGDGDDYLESGAGRDILIGGQGADSAQGGADDDILIGGTTAYDQNWDALEEISLVWQSSLSFDERVQLLTHGLDGSVRFVRETVSNDSIRDTLAEGSGRGIVFTGTEDAVRADAHDLIIKP